MILGNMGARTLSAYTARALATKPVSASIAGADFRFY